MDPARMFKESLTSHPELENSQGQKASFSPSDEDFRCTPVNGHRHGRSACLKRADSVEEVGSSFVVSATVPRTSWRGWPHAGIGMSCAILRRF
jgi:hypothetical protein